MSQAKRLLQEAAALNETDDDDRPANFKLDYAQEMAPSFLNTINARIPGLVASLKKVYDYLKYKCKKGDDPNVFFDNAS